MQKLRRWSHLGWTTPLFPGDGKGQMHNGLLQVLGTVVADCVHPLNPLHSVFARIQVWLNHCEVRA